MRLPVGDGVSTADGRVDVSGFEAGRRASLPRVFVWRTPSSNHHGTSMTRSITQALVGRHPPSESSASHPTGSAMRQTNERKNIPDAQIEALRRLAHDGPGRSAVSGLARKGAGIPGRLAPDTMVGILNAVALTRASAAARQVRSATGSPEGMPAINLNGARVGLGRAPSHIDTPMSALVAVLQQRHGVSARQRERILARLDTSMHIRPTPLAG
jgi:hypothetical protein